MTQVTILKMRDPWWKWPDAYCEPPTGFDPIEYQKKIDEICSRSRDKPILKLVWGGGERTQKYTEWDMFGNPTMERIEPKFKLLQRDLRGEVQLIPFRRWIISELCEPEQYELDSNTFTNEYGKECPLAEKPKEYYTPLIYVGDHTECPADCCEKRLCPGDYKHPDGAELAWIREKTYLLVTERIGDPRRPLGPMDMAKIASELDAVPKASVRIDEIVESIQPC